MTRITLNDIVHGTIEQLPIWSDGYKIPWNEPAFSERMLLEHLSQDHDLASRKVEHITRQIQWMHTNGLFQEGSKILDLGCGPGLYCNQLAEYRPEYLGIDFSPASIRHCHETCASDRHQFLLADVTEAPFSGPNDLVMMLYGEFNVFPPDTARKILSKAFAALKKGGRLLLEGHTWQTVRKMDQLSSWTAAPKGLFSSKPYICTMKGQWFAGENVARQIFYVIDAETSTGDVEAMVSTTKAWTEDEYMNLLSEAGFVDIHIEKEWPQAGDEFIAFTARKP